MKTSKTIIIAVSIIIAILVFLIIFLFGYIEETIIGKPSDYAELLTGKPIDSPSFVNPFINILDQYPKVPWQIYLTNIQTPDNRIITTKGKEVIQWEYTGVVYPVRGGRPPRRDRETVGFYGITEIIFSKPGTEEQQSIVFSSSLKPSQQNTATLETDLVAEEAVGGSGALKIIDLDGKIINGAGKFFAAFHLPDNQELDDQELLGTAFIAESVLSESKPPDPPVYSLLVEFQGVEEQGKVKLPYLSALGNLLNQQSAVSLEEREQKSAKNSADLETKSSADLETKNSVGLETLFFSSLITGRQIAGSTETCLPIETLLKELKEADENWKTLLALYTETSLGSGGAIGPTSSLGLHGGIAKGELEKYFNSLGQIYYGSVLNVQGLTAEVIGEQRAEGARYLVNKLDEIYKVNPIKVDDELLKKVGGNNFPDLKKEFEKELLRTTKVGGEITEEDKFRALSNVLLRKVEKSRTLFKKVMACLGPKRFTTSGHGAGEKIIVTLNEKIKDIKASAKGIITRGRTIADVVVDAEVGKTCPTPPAKSAKVVVKGVVGAIVAGGKKVPIIGLFISLFAQKVLGQEVSVAQALVDQAPLVANNLITAEIIGGSELGDSEIKPSSPNSVEARVIALLGEENTAELITTMLGEGFSWTEINLMLREMLKRFNPQEDYTVEQLFSEAMFGAKCMVLPASVDIKANGVDNTLNINSGEKVTISWESVFIVPGSCKARGVWSGKKPDSGSEQFGPYKGPAELTFEIVCDNLRPGKEKQVMDKVVVKVSPFKKLTCSPEFQQAETGQRVKLEARGGDGKYSWTAVGGVPSSGNGKVFRVKYNNAGTKYIELKDSAGNKAECRVDISSFIPLSCYPTEQTVFINQKAILTGEGGRGTYSWSTSADATPSKGNGKSFTPSYNTQGEKRVKLTDSRGNTARCKVNVVSSCTNECSLIGTTRCRGGDNIETCGNFDDDSCLEWGNRIFCSYGCVLNKCTTAGSGSFVCGNRFCEIVRGETPANCPTDCGGIGNTQNVCGDKICSSTENSVNCPQDCVGKGRCGNGICETTLGESPASCPRDCRII